MRWRATRTVSVGGESADEVLGILESIKHEKIQGEGGSSLRKKR